MWDKLPLSQDLCSRIPFLQGRGHLSVRGSLILQSLVQPHSWMAGRRAGEGGTNHSRLWSATTMVARGPGETVLKDSAPSQRGCLGKRQWFVWPSKLLSTFLCWWLICRRERLHSLGNAYRKVLFQTWDINVNPLGRINVSKPGKWHWKVERDAGVKFVTPV